MKKNSYGFNTVRKELKIPKSENYERYLYFDVLGAGQIEISESANWQCGGKTGFGFGVEWGKHGYAGGVISREEAIKLAEFILNTVGEKSVLRKEKLKKINEILEK